MKGGGGSEEKRQLRKLACRNLSEKLLHVEKFSAKNAIFGTEKLPFWESLF